MISRPPSSGSSGLDHFEARLAAAEQRREQPLEVAVDGVEGFGEAGLGLAVDLPDGAAQLGDGLLDVGAFLVDGLKLLVDLLQLVVGLQVDAAEPLAVGFETLQLAVELVQARQLGTVLDLG